MPSTQPTFPDWFDQQLTEARALAASGEPIPFFVAEPMPAEAEARLDATAKAWAEKRQMMESKR